MDDLIDDFVAETRDMLEALGSEIVAWEAAPHDRARLDAIFRFVHTVKGNCGFFDLPRLEHLTHAAEDALGEVRAGTRSADRALVSAVLLVIDRIAALVEGLETGITPPADDDRLITALAPDTVPLAGPAASQLGVRKSLRTVRVPVDLLEGMVTRLSDLMLARDELARLLPPEPAPDVEQALVRLSDRIEELGGAITSARMQRIDSLFIGLPRLVRDLSVELGKEVQLELVGGDMSIDRETIELLRHPLTHLVRNAIDHGIEAAEERVRAGKPEAGRLRVRALEQGQRILIEIEDDGRGIDCDALVERAVTGGRLSEREAAALTSSQKCALAFQAGISTAQRVTSISGRGVGMDVVRANVERIGGTIGIESWLGQGLRLTLQLPTVRVSASFAAGPAILEPGQKPVERVRAEMTCLVVDDSKVIRKAARHILEELNFAVEEAADGQQALSRCETRMPDLVLLDSNMPVMSGMEFLQVLRASGVVIQPKVVFCTTDRDPARVSAAFAAGADEYMMKPFDRDLIRRKLELVGLD